MNSSKSEGAEPVLHGITPRLCQTAAGLIEYADFGTGPVVVTIHGAMGGWDQSVILAKSALKRECRTIAVSRPGYLGTPQRSGTTPEQQADLIAALLDSLGIKGATVIAISGGGPCALAFALRHPQRCSGLVLISTCSVRNTARIPFAFYLMKALARIPFVVHSMRRKALGNIGKGMERAIQDPVVRKNMQGRPEVMALYTALVASTFDRMRDRLSGTDTDIRITRTIELPLENIQAPALVIHGTADRVVPFEEHARPFVSRLTKVKLLTVEGGEHVTLFTHLDVVRAEVAAFLDRGLS